LVERILELSGDSARRLDVAGIGAWRDLARMLDAAGIGAWRWNPADNSVYWSAATERLYGVEPGDFSGTFQDFMSRIHPDDVDDVVALIDRMAIRGGDYSVRHRILLPGDAVRWIEGQGRIVLGDDNTPVAGMGIVYDVSDRVDVETEKSRAERLEQATQTLSAQWRDDLMFLVEASDTLNASLNVERVASQLADLVTRRATGCVVDVKLGDPVHGVLTIAQTTSVDSSRVAIPDAGSASRRRLAHGATTDAEAERAPLLALLDDLDLEPAAASWVVEPLRARGSRIGSVLAWRSDQTWSDQERRLFENICRRGASALDAAELYRERSAVAAELHRSMNPENILTPPHWDIAVHYRPATDVARVSGDFFDVFEMESGDWLVALGDICGKGITAAGQAGLARAALRGASQRESDAAGILQMLNRVLRFEDMRPMMTSVIARLSTAGAGHTIELASAGHPAPLLLPADGAWQEVDIKGTMLGYVSDPSFVTRELTLDVGDAIIMFTDGITDARAGDEFFRIERLGRAVAEVAGQSATAIAQAATMAADLWGTDSERDDVALVVVRAGREPT
jgi:sigma-B regulation protein RsbU (phosphoserine phosphatase)